MALYFISDLHLSPSVPTVTAGFKAFLTELTPQDSLYILGDFFDAWIGDDEDAPYYRNIIDELRALTEQGIALFFQHGNRDFLIGDRFAEETGATLLPEEHLVEDQGLRAVVLHGDSLCTRDQEYMAFRAQARNPLFQQQILSLPLEQRRVMAAQLRAQSKHMNSNKAEDIMDVTPEEVSALFERHEVDTVIHGHTHRPQRHPHPHGERIVLGDWHDTGWYLKATDETLELVEFPL